MRVALTGATGMIGLSLTKLLVSNGINVILFIRENSKKEMLIPKSDLITVIKCNLENIQSFNKDICCDYFIHLGRNSTIGNLRDDVDTQLLNVSYTLDAVKLAKKMGCKKFIGIGSQAEYGLHQTKLKINTICKPVTAYGICKLCACQLARLLCEQLNIDFNWIRILSVYGEHDNPNTLISYVKRCFMNNVSPKVSKCEQIWDYISSDDAAKIIYKIMLYGKNGLAYPLGSGNGKPLKDYIEGIKRDMNSNVEICYDSRPYNKNQVMYLVADMKYLDKLK